MPIAVDIDVMLAGRKMSVGELANRVGITPANLAVLENGRAKAVSFATLAVLCDVLECQPGDLLRWRPRTPRADDVLARDTARGPHGRGSPITRWPRCPTLAIRAAYGTLWASCSR